MKLATIKEVSEFLKVKESTLYSWVYAGSIPTYRLNGVLRFDLEEIREWVKEAKITPSRPRVPRGKSGERDVDDIIKRAIEGERGKGL